ncbi:hypothetical protein [Slackia isoflavoniconvertens]|uniref:hypothetical protein n=1 Tax=Slackia isoflavoniconvertens TaxID=572010 RepID=UPI003F99C2B7
MSTQGQMGELHLARIREMGLQVIVQAIYFYFKRKVLSGCCWNAANSRLWDAIPGGNGPFAFSPGVILGAGEGEGANADDGCEREDENRPVPGQGLFNLCLHRILQFKRAFPIVTLHFMLTENYFRACPLLGSGLLWAGMLRGLDGVDA